jgi:hypothetical protein
MVKLALTLLLNACAPPSVAPVLPCEGELVLDAGECVKDCGEWSGLVEIAGECVEPCGDDGLVLHAGECVEPCGNDVCGDDQECVETEVELEEEDGTTSIFISLGCE